MKQPSDLKPSAKPGNVGIVSSLHYELYQPKISWPTWWFHDRGSEEEIKFVVTIDRANENLHEYLKSRKTFSKRWFRCFIEIIHHTHTLSIWHRDIKPSNILIKYQKVLLLADFGIPRMGLRKTMPTFCSHFSSKVQELADIGITVSLRKSPCFRDFSRQSLWWILFPKSPGKKRLCAKGISILSWAGRSNSSC